MNKLTKQYIANVKSLFPIMGKGEKDYIHSLSINIDDYCLEENVQTIQELYDHYGLPNDIVNTYFAMSDTSTIIKKIQLCKWVKRTSVILVIIVALSLGLKGYIAYNTYQTFLEEQAVFIDTTIEE